MTRVFDTIALGLAQCQSGKDDRRLAGQRELSFGKPCLDVAPDLQERVLRKEREQTAHPETLIRELQVASEDWLVEP